MRDEQRRVGIDARRIRVGRANSDRARARHSRSRQRSADESTRRDDRKLVMANAARRADKRTRAAHATIGRDHRTRVERRRKRCVGQTFLSGLSFGSEASRAPDKNVWPTQALRTFQHRDRKCCEHLREW